MMRHIILIFLASAISVFAEKEGLISPRPRGVPPQLAPFYEEHAEFECLDGSKKIPFDQVNDDYCDCPDGSDEPGTAACRNGKFYCPNSGYRPATIPSSRVNDYICDCCDGSDEWDSGTECPNICEAQGSKAREEAKKQQELERAGWTKRVELAKEGQKMMEEKRLELEGKRKELDELEAMKGGAESRKSEAEKEEEEAKSRQDRVWEEEKRRKERAEAEQMMAQMDANRDGKLSADELKKFVGFADEEGREGAKEGEEESTRTTHVLEQLKGIFPAGEEGADNSGTEQTLDLEKLAEKLYQVRDFLTKAKEEMLEEKKEEASKQEEGGGTGAETETTDEAQETEEEKLDEENIGGPQYDEATRELIDKADEARKEFNEIERKIGQLHDEIRDSEQFLEFEYGTDQAWAPLKGKCAELNTAQYIYKICLFDKTVQKDRGGYSEVNLGYWGTWNGPTEESKYAQQKYDRGQSCWNGPERSTIVELECGDELELVDASEPNKCEYKFTVKVPTACRNPDELKAEHSEL